MRYFISLSALMMRLGVDTFIIFWDIVQKSCIIAQGFSVVCSLTTTRQSICLYLLTQQQLLNHPNPKEMLRVAASQKVHYQANRDL